MKRLWLLQKLYVFGINCRVVYVGRCKKIGRFKFNYKGIICIVEVKKLFITCNNNYIK